MIFLLKQFTGLISQRFSIEPSLPELIRLLQSGGPYHFEITSLPGTSLADLDLLRFREYCQTHRNLEFAEHNARKLLENWQLIDSHGQMTVAGALFFASHPEIVAICKQLKLPLPQFQCDSTFIKTTVYKAGSFTQ